MWINGCPGHTKVEPVIGDALWALRSITILKVVIVAHFSSVMAFLFAFRVAIKSSYAASNWLTVIGAVAAESESESLDANP